MKLKTNGSVAGFRGLAILKLQLRRNSEKRTTMNTLLQIVAAIVTFVGSLAIPVFAFPLARALKRGRQGLDDTFGWDGKNAARNERIEDTLTHGAVLLVSAVVFLLVGVVFVWFAETYTMVLNPWIYMIFGNAPLWGSEQVGYHNAGPILFWTAAYWIMFVIGWIKTR